MDLAATLNAAYIDAQYKLWKTQPEKLTRQWRQFFEGLEPTSDVNILPAEETVAADQVERQLRVQALIERYREIGHLMSCLDPLSACPVDHPLLDLPAFGLTPQDLDREFLVRGTSRSSRMRLRDIIENLKESYCRSIGVEFMHLQDPTERQWLLERIEVGRNRPQPDSAGKKHICEYLYKAALFEQFLNKKYMAVTRFSLEGADAVIPAMAGMFEHVTPKGCQEIILGMAHRGRLNVQAHILQKPYEEIFSEFESCYNPDDLFGAGDVKYHNGYLADIKTAGDLALRIFLMNNPSHLESVNPVVEGFVRARQDITDDGERSRVLAMLVHGDAAFAGQGIVAETLNMSQLEGYRTGGTIHVVINNQIGYTTLPEHARSTRYSTDVAKMLMVPIFHVHGENPEALLYVFRLAADYRWQFGKDVVIDVVCYRRYGHNEGDEPYFTQPLMYEQIRQRPSLHQLYGEKLVEEKILQPDDLQALEQAVNAALDKAYDTVHNTECPFPIPRFYQNWEKLHGKFSHNSAKTGVAKDTLHSLNWKLSEIPDGFTLNPKLERLLNKRNQTVEQGYGIDWACAESLAFASLLTEGIPVRLSGQDSGRGTFSQRHSVFVDTATGDRYTPLNHLAENQAPFYVYDSLLSEVGVLGFEYGYSIAQPHGLVIWEAQFGDFVNNAQAIVDLFIASGEAKWQRLSGLVMLLPHGFEGLGPEHSSARLERFLQLCAGDNIQVCYPSTPAQYFHLLRRQVKGSFRKPLIVMTPKSLLRHPMAVSGLEEFEHGLFESVLDDAAEVDDPKTVLLCSGKIYYELDARRRELDISNIAIIRIEQFYPFPQNRLKKLAKQFPDAKKWCWVQEEPQNMGAWQFMQPRLEGILKRSVVYIGREPSASPATGFSAIFKQQQGEIIRKAVGSLSRARQEAAVS
jgi:2-oxoglutarate dehydrogenase E1 component